MNSEPKKAGKNNNDKTLNSKCFDLHRFSFPLNAALIDSETAEYSHLAQAQICV